MMDDETKKIERQEDAEKYEAEKSLDDLYDDFDYERDDREACESSGHPFAYNGSFGPSCECGNRVGRLEFTSDEVARGALNNAIWQHDRELPGGRKGQ